MTKQNYNRSYSSEDIDRFYSKVKAVESGCLEWQGATTKARGYGYGIIRLRGTNLSAHRVAYVLRFGFLSPEFDIHHKCGNKRCVNTHHLRAVFHHEHQANSLKTHCKRGHQYDSRNTLVDRHGYRYCKMCKNLWRESRNASHIA